MKSRRERGGRKLYKVLNHCKGRKGERERERERERKEFFSPTQKNPPPHYYYYYYYCISIPPLSLPTLYSRVSVHNTENGQNGEKKKSADSGIVVVY